MKLAAYLSASKMKPAAFAEKVGTSRQNVARWCAGVMPRRKELLRILAETEGKVTPNDFALGHPAKPERQVA